MRREAFRLFIALAAVGALPAAAQYRIGPIYPEKRPAVAGGSGGWGYDPFQLDWSTGRFVYSPMPYDFESAGASYNPFRFNWYSGRWDYVPYPGPANFSADAIKAMKAQSSGASEQIVNVMIPTATPPPGASPPNGLTATTVMASGVLTARPMQQPKAGASAVQTQSPSTQPVTPALLVPPVRDPLGLDPAIGRWEYDQDKGRWKHILPSD